jgi:hypothetical protein
MARKSRRNKMDTMKGMSFCYVKQTLLDFIIIHVVVFYII